MSSKLLTVLVIVITILLGSLYLGGYFENEVLEEDEQKTGFGYLESVQGTVLLGPTCPAIRVGEECPDRPYETVVDIYDANDSANLVKTTKSNQNGVFRVELLPGDYIAKAEGGNPLPRCSEVAFSIMDGRSTDIVIECDTGIR